MAAFFIIKLINTQHQKYWYYLGIVGGIGILTKYSIGFFVIAFVAGLFFTKERKWFTTKHPYLAAIISLVIASPNLWWQVQHGLPVVHHMTDLAETQLQNVDTLGFIAGQLVMQFAGLFIWLPGVVFLLFFKKMAPYRIIGLIYIGIIALLLTFSGKDYYSLGAYPMLFAAGGVALESWFKNKWQPLLAVGFIVTFVNMWGIPYGIPVFKLEKMKAYCLMMKDRFGLEEPLIWENGRTYDLPQDFADMHGWQELPEKVAAIYHGLGEEQKAKTMLYGGSYGHAGVLNHYRKQYNLPETYSFSSSYIMWVADSLYFDSQIRIDDNLNLNSQYFNTVILLDSIENPNARDPGYIIYQTDPKEDVVEAWKNIVKEVKAEYGF